MQTWTFKKPTIPYIFRKCGVCGEGLENRGWYLTNSEKTKYYCPKDFGFVYARYWGVKIHGELDEEDKYWIDYFNPWRWLEERKTAALNARS